ncbi:MAG: two-component system response regulator [Halobacteriaceae archaeon]
MAPTSDDQPQILVMDANERNASVLSDFLAEEGYEPEVVTDSEMAEEVVADASQFACALIDIDRFESPVWSYCDQLEDHDVPFVVLSGLQNPTLRQESEEHGAVEFVDKPLPKQQFRDLIETALQDNDAS